MGPQLGAQDSLLHWEASWHAAPSRHLLAVLVGDHRPTAPAPRLVLVREGAVRADLVLEDRLLTLPKLPMRNLWRRVERHLVFRL